MIHNCSDCASMLVVDCPNCGGFAAFMNGEASAQAGIATWLEGLVKTGGERAIHPKVTEIIRKGGWRPAPSPPINEAPK